MIAIAETDLLCFSIIVTGKCNLSCSYCHFYQKNDRRQISRHISDDLFYLYIDFISHIQRNHHRNIQVRFSGGEPLLLGEKLFEYSKIVFEKLGVKPFVLSNGKSVTHSIVEDCSKNCISGFFVSAENPFDVDSGSINPLSVIEKIKTLDSDKVQVKPAAVIIRNSSFNKLFEICEFFFDRTGEIPTITELNFKNFEDPSYAELLNLQNSIYRVVTKFFSKTALELFPYIVPELCYGFRRKFLVELDLNNNIGVIRENLDTCAVENLSKYLSKAYPRSRCAEDSCEYFDDCEHIKWVWEQNNQSYCRMKKAISQSYYSALRDIL